MGYLVEIVVPMGLIRRAKITISEEVHPITTVVEMPVYWISKVMTACPQFSYLVVGICIGNPSIMLTGKLLLLSIWVYNPSRCILLR